MDSSQQYIDMCKEATELQDEGRWWLLGDYYAEQIGEWHTSVFIGYEYYSIASDGRPIINWVWLPRQDQLQVMIDADYRKTLLGRMGNGEWQGLDAFVDFAYEDYDCTSMEQLWLAFLMHEKFNKHRNGTTWEVNDA